MNVIWIVSDTFRRNELGAYGNKTIRTPSLDALAAKSVRFDQHYTASFPTMPARADYMTGRWTMTYRAWEALRKDEVTLPPILSRTGFHTAAVVDTPFFLRSEMNYDRGFWTFFALPGQKTFFRGESFDAHAGWRFESDRFAPQTFTKATEWLEHHYKEDFFLYIDTWDPHEPWEAPSYYTELYWPGYDGEIIKPAYRYWQEMPGYTEETVKKAYATYCGEITMVDTWIGYFLRRLENMGLMEKTAIVFTTDHGIYFGEHGGLFGKITFGSPPGALGTNWRFSPLYRELIAIPLFVYVPNVPPKVYNGLTSAIDLAPTILDILGQEIPSSMQGQSLLPMVQDSSVAGRNYVISGFPIANAGDDVQWADDLSRRTSVATAVTVTTSEWALIYNPEPGLSELYYLPSDPKQEKNLISERPEIARELHQVLINFMRENKVPPHLLETRSELRL